MIFARLLGIMMACAVAPCLAQTGEKAPPMKAADPLALVKALCDTLKIERTREQDHFLLAGSTPLKGRLRARDIHLRAGDQDRALRLEEIAAITGSSGEGTGAQVYLRDGTVLSGALVWKEAVFENDTLGNIRLPERTTLHFIMHQDATDGRMDFVPAGILEVNEGGEVMALKELPAQPMRVRWAGGELQVPWREIAGLRRLPPPALGHEVALKDGSLVEAWLDLAASGLPGGGECLAFATNWSDLMLLKEGKPPAIRIAGLTLQTTGHSVLAGTWAGDALKLHAHGVPVSVRTEDIVSLSIRAADDGGTPTLVIFMHGSSNLSAQPDSATLAWRHSDVTLALPWHLIASINTPKKAAEKKQP